MRVLLTGGYGCIGSWIIRNLLDRGDEVFVFDLREDTRRLRLVVADADLRRATFVAGDVTDFPLLRRTIDERRISHVIHLAGLQVPTCRADPLLGAKVNVLGTLAVFEAVRLAQPQVERLVYASSAAVYGPPEAHYRGVSTALPDDTPLMPNTHYGAFKCCNETNARVYFQDFGLSSIGLRPSTVYGVGRDFGMTSEPTKAIKSVALGRPYAISYGGMQDLQLAEDVARTFIQASTAEYRGAKSYNLRGSVVDMTVFYSTLCEIAPEARRLISHDTRQLSITYDLDDSGLQRDIGRLAKTSLEKGVRRTYELFCELASAGSLDTSDLDAPATPKSAPTNEP